MLEGFMTSQLLYCAVRFGVADKLAKGPMTKDELAKACEAVPERVERMMLALISSGVFALDPADSRRFVNNAVSSTLRNDHPNCMASLVGHWIEDSWGPWGRLYDDVKEGGCVWKDKKFCEGKSFWDYLEMDPARGRQCDRAMTAFDSLGAWAMVFDGPFGTATRVIDVGGGRGHFLAKILQTHASLSGIVFDLPQVIEQSATPAWAPGGPFAALRDRGQLKAGSFFDVSTIPEIKEGDMIFMRFILHDWDDQSATRILTNLRTAIGSKAGVRLEICEIMLPDRDKSVDSMRLKYYMDLHMALLLGSKERSSSEWEALFRATGFVCSRVFETRSICSVIEAVPVYE